MQPKLVVITGPTASGKTALGVALAQRLGGEVVSADSMQIYRGMDIGTAKPTPEEMQGVPHHMIDIADPAENYSVSRYAAQAVACVDDILARGKLPIVVGGTGLYIDSLIAGRTFADGTADTALRQELSERYDEIGGEGLLGELRGTTRQRSRSISPTGRISTTALTGAWTPWCARACLTRCARCWPPVSRPTARPCRPSATRRPLPPCGARHRRRTPSPPSSSPPGAMPSASSRGCGAIRTCSGSGTKKRRTWTWRAAFRRNSYPAAV